MEHGTMDMDTAIDSAVETATTAGLGEEIAADETSQPVVETPPATSEPKPEVEAEAVAEEHSDLAERLADLTHTEVVQTKAGKGLVAELQRERAKRQELQTQLDAAKAAKVEVEPETTPEEDEIADDADVFTAADVKKIVAGAIAKAVKPLADRVGKTARAERSQIMATGLAALKAEQKAGSIPVGVNIESIVNQAFDYFKANRPGTYNDLLSDPDPVRSAWQEAMTHIPEVRKAVTAAAKTRQEIEQERLARGRSPDTGDEPTTVDNLIADLNAP